MFNRVDGYDRTDRDTVLLDRTLWYMNMTPDRTIYHLRTMETYCNQLLNTKECMFINEVYDILEIPRTLNGAKDGWLKGDVIDFGIYTNNNVDIINGCHDNVLLVFNPRRNINELL